MGSSAPPTCAFLNIPGELRNKIYDICFTASPRADGLLHGYVDVPSEALLRTCSKINGEAALLHHSSLKDALLQDKILIHLRSSDVDDEVRQAGWIKTSGDRFDIWVRKDKEPEDEVGGLISRTLLWYGGILGGEQRDLVAIKRNEAEVLELLGLVEGWMRRFAGEGKYSAVMRRIYCIHGRLQQTVGMMRTGAGTANDTHQAATFDLQTTYRPGRRMRYTPGGKLGSNVRGG